jgi:transcriptional regulator with XRE-family HTH domain
MQVATKTLPLTLQSARKARRLSQLELSLRVGVSQRHVSFVESGRAKPSRPLFSAWLRELDAPLALQNAAMLQAGYAPVYAESQLDSPTLAQANDALLRLLGAHDPMPALVLDIDWNVLQMNRGAKWLAATLVPWAEHALDATPFNLLDLMLHPEGFCKPIVNLDEVGPVILGHLRQSATVRPLLAPKVEVFAEMLRTRAAPVNESSDPLPSPVLTTRFATRYGELAFFSMFTTFGTPQDITLASLRVEHMFAADEGTRFTMVKHIR